MAENDMSSIPTTGFASSGYTCGRCGQWVVEGTMHWCQYQVPPQSLQPTITTTQPDYSFVLAGILAELQALRKDFAAIQKRKTSRSK